MRICLELTSSSSQLALHRTRAPVDGLSWGNETELSSPGRVAVAIAPRRAARPEYEGGRPPLRRLPPASHTRGRHAKPQPRVPVHDEAENSS